MEIDTHTHEIDGERLVLVDDSRQEAPPVSLGRPWLTYVVIAICAMISVYLNICADNVTDEANLREAISPPAIQIWAGSYWGLVTSAFVHVAFWHILFNMWWARDFGRVLEPTMGRAKYAVFIIFSAIASAGAQLAFSGQTGIGFSGVVFAMFGYGMAARHVEPAYRGIVSTSTVNWLLGWLVVCIIMTIAGIWNIANAAHVGGFLFGLCVGNVFARRFHVVLCTIGLVLLLVLSVLSVTYMPWSTTWRMRGLIADFIATRELAETGDPAGQYRYAQYMAASESSKQEAIALFRESAGQGHVPAMNDLAWLLATDQDAGVRNADKALDWARRACEADGWMTAMYIDTLAAAHAEAGEWDDAIAMQRMAIEKLTDDRPATTRDFESRLQRYLNREKTRE